MDLLKNNQIKPSGKHGGPRTNSGRKKGTTNKISGASILDAIKKQTNKNFETLLAQGYHDSIVNNDKFTRLQYEKMFLSKVVADKQEIDMTSNGQTIGAVFHFPQKELPDWNIMNNIPVTITTDASTN